MTAEAASVPALLPRLQLFGRFRLARAGGEVPLPGRKARAVLAYLALTPGGSATREQLADLLWTDRAPEQARASLRQSLKELRELPGAGQAIAITHASVTLNLATLAVDLNEIRDAAAAHDLAALAELLEQARGDLLEDFLDVAPAFDEWLEAERPRMRDFLLGEAIEAVASGGTTDMRNARRILTALDRIDPASEAVARLTMRLDHAAGDAAALHRRYRQLCDRLESEFGAQPSEETRALFHSLAANREPAPASSAAAVAPAVPTAVAGGSDLVPLVIVAPLQTGSADEALASVAEFCADDVRVSLSRMRGMHVLAADDADLDAVLRQGEDALGIYLLSGSLRRFGGDIRVTVQLANAATRVILWSDTLRFGEAGEDLLDTVAGKAAGAIQPAIDRDLDARLRQAAFDLHDERATYTRARLLIRSGAGLPAVREGVRLLEQVVEANPRHLGAHLLLVRMYSTDFWQQIAGHDVRQFRERSEQYLRAAAAIEPGHYLIRICQAWYHLRRGEAGSARREFEALMANMPHDADVIDGCALGYCWLGQLDEAERLMQRAFFLNPFPPSDYHADYAIVLAFKGEHEAAEEHFAVSGETGLKYAAVRIANAAHLDGGAERIAPCRADFATGFRRAWQGEREPALTDVLDWAGYTLALSSSERLERFRQDLRQMLEPFWKEAPDNGR